MESLLVKLMLIAALAELGMSITDFGTCHTRECAQKIEQRERDISHIDWKPISIFPEEAKRFQ